MLGDAPVGDVDVDEDEAIGVRWEWRRSLRQAERNAGMREPVGRRRPEFARRAIAQFSRLTALSCHFRSSR